MGQINELEHTFIEEYDSALLLFKMGKLKSSLILFSKALFALVDYFILSKYQTIPKNHSSRFRILEEAESELYIILDQVWRTYVDSYTHPSFNNSIEKIREAILTIIKLKNEDFSEKIREIVEQ